MGSIDSAFGANSEGGFEPDDFYESFLAPKFHDFTAPEEPIDPDAYFLSQPGMLKKAFAIEEVKTVAPKIHKVAAQEAPTTAPISQQQVPPKSPVAAEKTVRVGSAKKTSLLSSPLTSKSLKNGINSPAQQHQQLPMLEKSLKPTSLAKKLQASENDDPNSPNRSPNVKAVKPALTRQRSQKVTQEVEKPALTRQRSQKYVEATKPTILPHSDSSESSNSEKESDQGKGISPKKEHTKTAVVSNGGALKSLKQDHMSVKEVVSNCPEVKKCHEIAGSPFSGHHCKHPRCAANDPNFASPVATKKYLIAKKGTPGSIRKAATPAHEVGVDVSSENSDQRSDDVEEPFANGNGNDCDAPKAKGHRQVALVDAFNKITLEQITVTKQVTVTTISNTKEFASEVSSEGDKKKSLSADDIRDWSRNSVNLEEKTASSSSDSLVATTVESSRDSKSSAAALFLQVASDCLENIDLSKLTVPPTKIAGIKRKSNELLPTAASKKANCAADGNNKSMPKKVAQAKDFAASKAAKMKLRRLSVARRLSVVRSKPGVTNPRPFRLRTQERGAMKEKEFIKKVEEYKAAKEGFHSAFQGLAAVDSKIPGKFLKSGHVFSAQRADPKDDKEVTKPTIPVAHKAPHFDHPFKPHRSTKKLTVPVEPKFHTVRGSRHCPSHVVVPSA